MRSSSSWATRSSRRSQLNRPRSSRLSRRTSKWIQLQTRPPFTCALEGTAAAVINDHILSRPQAVTDALDTYKQGDLVEGPPFFYWGDGRHPLWRATENALEEDEDDVVVLDQQPLAYG